MPTTVEADSTLTDRYQTTVPEAVRRFLRLGKRAKLRYSIRPSGEVVLSRATTVPLSAPVIDAFLVFLARDMTRHPEQLQTLDARLVQKLQSLVGEVETDLDAALSAKDE